MACSTARSGLHYSGLLGLCVLLLTTPPLDAAGSRNFIFTLPTATRVSGGVYDGNEKLIKTLFSGRTDLQAGEHIVNWDGNYDNHYGVVNAAPEGTYTLKAVANRVVYTWDGGIGNTSAGMLGENVWKSLSRMKDMAINSNGVGIAALGYAEGPATAKRFSTSSPQSPTNIFGIGDSTLDCNYVAIDANRMYVSATGHGRHNSTFVVAFNIADNTSYAFSSGQTISTTQPKTHAYAIDVSQRIADPPVVDRAFVAKQKSTGLAVQQSGNILAVSHGGLNLVKLFDKTTGALTKQIAITSPGRIAFAPNGDLWVINGSNLSRFAAATLGETHTPDAIIPDLTSPLAVAVDPTDNNKVLLMDGANHQLKCYGDRAGWTVQWTLGMAGGYNATNGPAVSANKLWLSAGSPVLAYQPNGSFWVGDGGNYRVVHYSKNRKYLEQIAYLPALYNMCVDVNMPTRVFTGPTGLMEYQIDYTQSLTGGDPGSTGAWRLVNNWGAGLDPARYGAGVGRGFQNVATLGGHTYAQLSPGNEIVELRSNGEIRFLGKTGTLYGNGDLRSGGHRQPTSSYYRHPGSGFASGNPSWPTNGTLIASVTGADGHNDPTGLTGERIAITSTKRVILFNRQGHDTTVPGSYHLGAIALNGTDWLWRAAPGKVCTGSETDGSFGIEAYGGLNGIEAFADGRNVIFGFNGQYVPYSNKYLHFWDNGLYVGQCGVNGPSTEPGTCGNVVRMAWVANGATRYIYTSDENTHGAAQRFSVTGLDTIAEITGADTTRPADPSNLVGQPLPLSATQIKLTWIDNSDNETGFQVERATDGNYTRNLTTVAITAANATTFTDTVGSTQKTFHYRIKAKGKPGDSGYTYAQSALWESSNFLQQGRNGYAGVADTTLNNYYRPEHSPNNLSFGGGSLGVYDRSPYEQARTLIRFDMTPVQGIITDARLVLTKQNQSPNGPKFYNETIALHRVADANKDWQPGTAYRAQQNGAAVWNYKADQLSPGTRTSWAGSAGMSTPDIDYAAAALAITNTGDTADAPITWTLKDVSMLNDWVANPGNNAGFFLREINPIVNGHNSFYSSEDKNQEYRPKLVLAVKAYTPAFSPSGGASGSKQTVMINCATPGVAIRYTTDGSTPSPTNGKVYEVPLAINATTTLKAMAFTPGMTDSDVGVWHVDSNEKR